MDRRSLLTGATAAAASLSVPTLSFAQSPQVKAADAPKGELLYANPLKSVSDVKDFRLEGEALVDFDTGKMRLQNAVPADKGQESNFVYWCPEVFPDQVDIRWKIAIEKEPGLCILLFAARGILPDGGDCHVLDKRLKPRKGIYEQYTSSDVSALTMAYFRRRWPEERAFHLCNLRRAPGFEMLAQAGDPLPDVADATPPYQLRLVKRPTGAQFFINNLLVIDWHSGSPAPRPAWPGGGSIGFRQMAPLVATYSDLEVYRLLAGQA